MKITENIKKYFSGELEHTDLTSNEIEEIFDMFYEDGMAWVREFEHK